MAGVLPPEEQNFGDALVNVVGFTNAQVITIRQDGGILTADTLALCDDDAALDSLSESAHPLNAITKTRFKTFMGWCYDQSRAINETETIDPTQFTVDIMHQLMRQDKDRARNKAMGTTRTKDDGPKLPDTWNGKVTDWKKKKRELVAFLGQKASKRGDNIPLVYVIYDENDGDFHIDDNAPQLLQQIRDADRAGPDFQADNFTIHNILTQWTSGGIADTFLDIYSSTRDGRTAWQSLLRIYDGENAKDNLAREGRRLIDTSTFF